MEPAAVIGRSRACAGYTSHNNNNNNHNKNKFAERNSSTHRVVNVQTVRVHIVGAQIREIYHVSFSRPSERIDLRTRDRCESSINRVPVNVASSFSPLSIDY